MKRIRRHFSGTEKVAILRRHLLDSVPISDLCTEYDLQPTVFYRCEGWRSIVYLPSSHLCRYQARLISTKVHEATAFTFGERSSPNVNAARGAREPGCGVSCEARDSQNQHKSGR